MFLADIDIIKGVQSGDIVLEPFDEKRVQPASYDILLGNKFIVNRPHQTCVIDPVKGIFAETEEILIPEDGQYVLHPGVSILGTSVDHFGSKKYLIQLSGKSSLARIGLVVHNTAGLINPGHFLKITFELCNLNNVPIVLRPNMPIAQLLFSPLSSMSERDYKETGRFGEGDNNWKMNFTHKE